MQRSKILIVDDKPHYVDQLEHLLEEHSYETVVASDGQEALRRVATEVPDLILLDAMLPVMDGFTVCRTLKAQEQTRLTPVVMMSALGALEYRMQGLEAGADAFLTSPVHTGELLAHIRTALRRKQSMDQTLGTLHRATEQLAKFVPETVKHLVTVNPAAPALAKRVRDVSVLFLNISGYAQLCEHVPPDMLNTLVERYFATFLDCIHAAGGEVNEIARNGFMALFQDPDPQRHAITAVETALALGVATATLNAASNASVLSMHMGINSGKALVGSTRFEGERGMRYTFTASGSVTNLAARLASMATAGQILLGPDTARRVEPHYQPQRLGHTPVHNFAAAVDIWEMAP